MPEIKIGDRFYYNNFSTRMGHCLPDYLIVTNIKNDFLEAKYENHRVYTKERIFSVKNLKNDSNLNPKIINPSWIFTKMVSKRT